MINFFKWGSQDKQPEQQISLSDPKDVPIAVHTQDWLKAKPDEPPVEGNMDSQLTRLFHVERIWERGQ